MPSITSTTSANMPKARDHDNMQSIKEMFCKEYGVDTSEYLMRKADLDKIPGSIFVDEHFPPTRESLCHNWDEI